MTKHRVILVTAQFFITTLLDVINTHLLIILVQSLSEPYLFNFGNIPSLCSLAKEKTSSCSIITQPL